MQIAAVEGAKTEVGKRLKLPQTRNRIITFTLSIIPCLAAFHSMKSNKLKESRWKDPGD